MAVAGEIIRVPIQEIYQRVKSRKDMYLSLVQSCKSFLLKGKFYLPEQQYCSV